MTQPSYAVRPFCVGCGVDVAPIMARLGNRSDGADSLQDVPIIETWWPGCPVCGDRALCLECLRRHKVYHNSRVIVSSIGQ